MAVGGYRYTRERRRSCCHEPVVQLLKNERYRAMEKRRERWNGVFAAALRVTVFSTVTLLMARYATSASAIPGMSQRHVCCR